MEKKFNDNYDESAPYLGLESLKSSLNPESFCRGPHAMVFYCYKYDGRIGFGYGYQGGGSGSIGTTIPIDSPMGKWLEHKAVYYFDECGIPHRTLEFNDPGWGITDRLDAKDFYDQYEKVLAELNKDNPALKNQ